MTTKRGKMERLDPTQVGGAASTGGKAADLAAPGETVFGKMDGACRSQKRAAEAERL